MAKAPSDAAPIVDGNLLTNWPKTTAARTIGELRAMVASSSRPGRTFGIEGFANLANRDPREWQRAVRDWKDVGATHLSMRTLGIEATAAEHLTLAKDYIATVTHLL